MVSYFFLILGESRTSEKSYNYLHLVILIYAIVFTIAPLCFNAIDGDGLTGVCQITASTENDENAGIAWYLLLFSLCKF